MGLPSTIDKEPPALQATLYDTIWVSMCHYGLPWVFRGEESTCNAEDTNSIPGSEISWPEEPGRLQSMRSRGSDTT